MNDGIGKGLDSFDEMFNDDFIAEADDEEIENRFKYLEDNCSRHQLDYNELLLELEFQCNSFIHDMVISKRRDA